MQFRFKFDPNANVQNFKFGQTAPEDFARIPKKVINLLFRHQFYFQKPSTVPKAAARPASLTKKDAKEMSKKPKIISRPLTLPVDKTLVDYLATPKGQTPIRSKGTQPVHSQFLS